MCTWTLEHGEGTHEGEAAQREGDGELVRPQHQRGQAHHEGQAEEQDREEQGAHEQLKPAPVTHAHDDLVRLRFVLLVSSDIGYESIKSILRVLDIILNIF